MTTINIYIAGPMTGIKDFNYPAFHKMEKQLEAYNGNGSKVKYIILNPARIAGGDTKKPYDFYIRESLKLISLANIVVFLNGWRNSSGANLEYSCAKLMGVMIVDESLSIMPDEPLNVKKEPLMHEESICVTADKLVNDDRQDTYGHPFWNFKDIATMWGVVLDKDNITPEQVGLCMMGTKIAREKHMHKLDNLVDAAGYAKAVQKIKQYRLEHDL